MKIRARPENKETPFARPGDPVLTTRWFDVAAGITWLIYGLWAFASIFQELPTFAIVGAPLWYTIVWQVLIIVSCVCSAFGALSVFFTIPRWAPIRKKRLERDGLWVLLSMLFVYFGCVLWIVVTGDYSRIPVLIITLGYFTFPSFRVFHLTRRIRIQAEMALRAQVVEPK